MAVFFEVFRDATGTVRVAATMSVTSMEMSVVMDFDGSKGCGLSTVIDGLGATRAKGRFLASVSDRKFQKRVQALLTRQLEVLWHDLHRQDVSLQGLQSFRIMTGWSGQPKMNSTTQQAGHVTAGSSELEPQRHCCVSQRKTLSSFLGKAGQASRIFCARCLPSKPPGARRQPS